VLKLDLRRPEDCVRAVEDMDYAFICAAHTSGAAVIRATPLAHVTPNTSNTLAAPYFCARPLVDPKMMLRRQTARLHEIRDCLGDIGSRSRVDGLMVAE
jgi:hypothetical protein